MEESGGEFIFDVPGIMTVCQRSGKLSTTTAAYAPTAPQPLPDSVAG